MDMDVRLSVSDLREMHPQLLWNDLSAATAAVLEPQGSVCRLALEYQDVPGFGTSETMLSIDISKVTEKDVERLRRTYEPPRLVELAAIAIAGFALYYGGGHEITDVSVRGSSADYLVDASNQLLEVGGRSRRSDFEAAWKQKCDRLNQRRQTGYYVCLVEFETPFGRLGYFK